MHLTKHHGLGNDFLVALVPAVPGGAANLARAWCHRRTGVGADGLIFGVGSETADVEMVLFNSDGSEAEISGNGIRCLAQAVARKRGDASADLVIATAGGVRGVQVQPGSNADEVLVAVDMGAVGEGPMLPSQDALERPRFSTLRVGTASVGNPHVVLEVDDHTQPDPALDGPALEALWKPGGINVHFMQATGTDEITLVHWERGAGVTQACGSGATAAATLANAWGLVGSEVTVHMPGGSARVTTGPTAVLAGPAAFVADIEVSHG